METSIRFLRIERRAIKPVLCFRGRNQVHAVVNDETCIRTVSQIPIAQYEKAPVVVGPVGLGHREYPIDLFVERFQKIGQTKPTTLRAQYFLKRALEGGVADNETLPPDTLPGGAPPPVKPEFPVIALPGHPGGPSALARRPTPDKPAKPSVAPIRKPGGAVRTAGADVIRTVAAELKLETTKLRKLLRAAGLRAPYDDIAKVRAALK